MPWRNRQDCPAPVREDFSESPYVSLGSQPDAEPNGEARSHPLHSARTVRAVSVGQSRIGNVACAKARWRTDRNQLGDHGLQPETNAERPRRAKSRRCARPLASAPGAGPPQPSRKIKNGAPKPKHRLYLSPRKLRFVTDSSGRRHSRWRSPLRATFPATLSLRGSATVRLQTPVGGLFGRS